MKELSVEEKAKRYDSMFERLKEMYNNNKTNVAARLICERYFPELKECEDKMMIQYFKDLAPFDKAEELYEKYGFSHKDAIAWLEKQAEHANFRNKIQVGDKVTRNEDGVLVNLSQLNRVAKKDEKQGEQNLIKHFCDCVHVGCHVNDCKRWCHSYQKEISYTDCNSNCNRYSKLMNHAFNIGETITDGISTFKITDIKDNYYIADDGERVEIYMAHRYYTTIQNLEAQKPAWSEEDEKQARQIERIVHDDGCTQKLQKQIANWLKSLKDRVQPQSKQEWGEEDEKTIEEAIGYLEKYAEERVQGGNSKQYIFSLASRLDHLRPQSTWKPSDEQMLAINTAINIFGNDTLTRKCLIELQEQLKKLREE